MHIRSWWPILVLVGLSACSAPTLTVPEYADEIEDLVAVMEERFAEADADWEGQQPSLEGAIAYWDERLDIRNDFLSDLEEIPYPPEVEAMHETSLELFRRITAADVAIAESVEEYGDVTEHRPWLATEEGQASLAILAEVYEFCRSSQAEFDATSDRQDLEDVPWLPPEMSEVIKVAFGCPPQDS
jgi:hypothetical protein